MARSNVSISSCSKVCNRFGHRLAEPFFGTLQKAFAGPPVFRTLESAFIVTDYSLFLAEPSIVGSIGLKFSQFRTVKSAVSLSKDGKTKSQVAKTATHTTFKLRFGSLRSARPRHRRADCLMPTESQAAVDSLSYDL